MGPHSKSDAPQDCTWKNVSYRPSELEHNYGPNVHILSDPILLTYLAKLCQPSTVQPQINQLIERIYEQLFSVAVNAEFTTSNTHVQTRMHEFHPEGVYHGSVLDPETLAVSVNLARAGTLPSHVCYNSLNTLLPPSHVRQDHISIARQTGSDEQVTGSAVSGHKIGGPVKGAYVLFPDPMGATGSTLVRAMDLYKKEYGQPKKAIALHCIITPEYLRTIRDQCPELVVYAARLDRGLSPKDVLNSIPGTQWDRERGLNDKSYIVPGAGGLGEVLNNAFV